MRRIRMYPRFDIVIIITTILGREIAFERDMGFLCALVLAIVIFLVEVKILRTVNNESKEPYAEFVYHDEYGQENHYRVEPTDTIITENSISESEEK